MSRYYIGSDPDHLRVLGALSRRGLARRGLGAIAQLVGITSKTAVQEAALSIGLDFGTLRALIGEVHGDVEIGQSISPRERAAGVIDRDNVVDAVRRARAIQVGPREAGATVSAVASGIYEGGEEPSVVVSIIYRQTAREEVFSDFERNIQLLAEKLASDFAQKEILVRWADGTLQSASPVGLPEPGPDLDAWLGEHIT